MSKICIRCGTPLVKIDYDLGQARQIKLGCPKCGYIPGLDKIIKK